MRRITVKLRARIVSITLQKNAVMADFPPGFIQPCVFLSITWQRKKENNILDAYANIWVKNRDFSYDYRLAIRISFPSTRMQAIMRDPLCSWIENRRLGIELRLIANITSARIHVTSILLFRYLLIQYFEWWIQMEISAVDVLLFNEEEWTSLIRIDWSAENGILNHPFCSIQV